MINESKQNNKKNDCLSQTIAYTQNIMQILIIEAYAKG